MLYPPSLKQIHAALSARPITNVSQAAREASLTQPWLSRFINGHVEDPSYSHVYRLVRWMVLNGYVL